MVHSVWPLLVVVALKISTAWTHGVGDSSQGAPAAGVDQFSNPTSSLENCHQIDQAYILKNWTHSQSNMGMNSNRTGLIFIFSDNLTDSFLYQELIYHHNEQEFERIGQPVEPSTLQSWRRFPSKNNTLRRTFDRVVGSVKGVYYFGARNDYTIWYIMDDTQQIHSRTNGVDPTIKFVAHYYDGMARELQWTIRTNRSNENLYLSLTYWGQDKNGTNLRKSDRIWTLSNELSDLLLDATSFAITDHIQYTDEFGNGHMALIVGSCYTYSIIIPSVNHLLNASQVDIVLGPRYLTENLIDNSSVRSTVSPTTNWPKEDKLEIQLTTQMAFTTERDVLTTANSTESSCKTHLMNCDCNYQTVLISRSRESDTGSNGH